MEMLFATCTSFVLSIAMLLTSSSATASVVGQLSRFEVKLTASKTYRVYGQVDEFCSGTMISPRLVLTAAHCVYDLETKAPMNPRYYSPGRNPMIAPYGKIKITAAHIDQAYIDGDTSRDVAILVLDVPIGLKTGWLPISWDHQVLAPHNSPLGGWSGPGTIVGYPGDKNEHTMWLVACDFYVAPLQPRSPQYTCDTFGGMSGSSLVVAGSKGPTIFGVHTTGRGHFNTGIVLAGKNKEFVQKIMKAYSL